MIQCHSSTIPNVNVLPLNDNRARGQSLMRSRRETGLCGSTESAVGIGLLRFQGRCFQVRQQLMPRSPAGSGPAQRAKGAGQAGKAAVFQHHWIDEKASTGRGWCLGPHLKAPFCRQGAATPANGRMSSAHPPKRWRYVSPGASGLVAGTATNRHADRFTRLAHETGAWKLNANAQRAVVPSSQGMAERNHREPRGSLSLPKS